MNSGCLLKPSYKSVFLFLIKRDTLNEYFFIPQLHLNNLVKYLVKEKTD